ncbi:MAG: hypothetical protein WCV59_01350 [Parcubacteria group bacterium]|jgi:hypothetical protein
MKTKETAEEKREFYQKRLEEMDDQALYNECLIVISNSNCFLSSPDSAFHWQSDLCGEECQRREKHEEIFKKAHNEVWSERNWTD